MSKCVGQESPVGTEQHSCWGTGENFVWVLFGRRQDWKVGFGQERSESGPVPVGSPESFKGRVIPTEMYFESWAAGWGRTRRRKGYTDMPGQQQASCRVKRKKHWLSSEKVWASQYCK